jgi:PhzF family phenazine biosynthesis protein
MNTQQNITVKIVNAFTANGGGGNPAGLVLNADAYTPAEKLAIAAAVGVSETAFVSTSAVADFKLDFFTPTRQIAHCGHATIAAFSYLHQQGLIKGRETSKETIDGTRKIRITPAGAAFMEQRAPVFTPIESAEAVSDILSSLGLLSTDLIPGAPLMKVNTGNSFIIIPVAKADELAKLTPDFSSINRISEVYDLIGYYAFTTETGTSDYAASTRMFAPRYGIEEESATGMAAGPLACYLHTIMEMDRAEFRIQQGKYMQPAALSSLQVELELRDGEITGLQAGGFGKLMETK